MKESSTNSVIHRNVRMPDKSSGFLSSNISNRADAAIMDVEDFRPVDYSDIVAARHRIAGVAYNSPVLTSDEANRLTGAHIFFKCENLQRGGAFKFRGAYNALSRLTPPQRQRGVVTFSSGNYGCAVAIAARLLDIPAIAVMPHDAPFIKLDAVRRHGACVMTYDRETEDRQQIAHQIAGETGCVLIPPYDDSDVVAGQGTACQELLEEVGPLDYLLVAIGGGSLIAGSAIAAHHMDPGCEVIGVEPALANDAQLSLREGCRVKIDVPTTIADGARTQQLGQIEFAIIRRLVRSVVTVNDDQLRRQMIFFAEEMKLLVEPTGCLAAAAALNNRIDIADKRVGVIVTGGNVDLSTFCHCIDISKMGH